MNLPLVRWIRYESKGHLSLFSLTKQLDLVCNHQLDEAQFSNRDEWRET